MQCLQLILKRLKENQTLQDEIVGRKKLEKELEAARRQLVRILDLVEEAIISVNVNRQITFFNRQAESLFGYSCQEVLQSDVEVILSTLDISPLLISPKNKPAVFHTVAQSKKGIEFQVQVVMKSIPSKELL